MNRKVKRLCDNDVKEIVSFQQYLADVETMERTAFYRKYQEYLELSDAELLGILKSIEAKRGGQG